MSEPGRLVVAITGASRGIGHATALRFAGQGHVLALGDLLASGGWDEEIRASAIERGGDAFSFVVDVSSPDEARRFIETVEERCGRVDVLVNNAGILRSGPTHEVAWSDWEAVISTNLGGTWSCLRAALPGMIRRGWGRIINVSSELGLIGYPTYAAYCASKGGVIALTKAVAKEVARYGVLVNSVAPGPVVTDMLVNDTAEYNDETRLALPLQRFGTPSEIALVIEFLAGPGGAYFVGQVISPNGGAAI